MDPVILFGAGTGGKIVKWMLNDFGIPVKAFTDNGKDKWGTMLDGIPVIPPDSLQDDESRIVIASTWESEIREQLTDMGMGSRVVGKEVFMHQYLEQSEKMYSDLSGHPVDSGKRPTFLFGTDLGLYQGGVESWTYTVADELRKRGYGIKILTNQSSQPAPERFQKDTYYLNMRGREYCSGLRDTVHVIMENAPCVVIDSWQSMTMLAAAIVKRQNGAAVRELIEVVHNDLPRLFGIVKKFEDEINACMGVSRDINRSLVEDYQIAPEKVHYKESPVKYDAGIERDYAFDESQPLRIGYAARLSKSQKRADLLPELMDRLMERKVHFRMQIAGSGALRDRIQNHITEKGYAQFVSLTGYIPREEMNRFWSGQDIFINLSEYEGVGLSMLEAMGYGCVPIVTKVAGSEEFVEEDIGYICEIGDLDAMAEKIAYLDRHREKLGQMGKTACESARKKCSVEAYVDHLLGLTAEGRKKG
ncbi:MAG: glycosyltransferase [Lachnospiraceae bacterium]|nr:glycosyltransferase [Lachnospiraceae bacterium]